VENQAECFKFWKKIQGLPQTLSQIQWGGGVEKSGRVFEILEKKIQGSRGHLAKFSGGGVENQAEYFFYILEKKFKGSRRHLAKFSGGGVENQAECLKILEKKIQGLPQTLS
jgi:hypothetical protein